MKRFFLLFLLAFSFLTSTIAEHQMEIALLFKNNSWNFGYTNENKGKISHTFYFTNRSKSAIVIEDVISTCGCTVASYSKEPVMPQKRGYITVTFDPKGRINYVSKSLKVISNSGKSINTLYIKGNIKLQNSWTSEFPYKLDSNIYCNLLTLSFGQIQHNTVPQILLVKLYNRSSHIYDLSYSIINKTGCITVDMPTLIRQNSIVNIKIKASPIKKYYGSLYDNIQLIVGRKKVSPINIFGTIIGDMRKSNLKIGPKLKCSNDYFNLGSVKKHKSINCNLKMTNNGSQPLIIYKIEFKGNLSSNLVTPIYLQKGAFVNAKFTMSFLSEDCPEYLVRLITNDPVSPVHTINFEAKNIY